jgi:SOS response regulatory protein OraA/RecX
LPEVTEIRRGPRGSRRRRVFVDGEEWRALPADVLADAGIREGASIDPVATLARIDDSLPVQAWERALRLITFRERGTGELTRRLSDDGYPDAVVAATLARADELGFLDDRRFADSLVRGLTNGRGLGRRRVEAELSAKGVDEALAGEMLGLYCSEDHERERAQAMARRLLKTRSLEPRKLASRLVAKGFAPSLAFDVARESHDASQRAGEAPDEAL